MGRARPTCCGPAQLARDADRSLTQAVRRFCHADLHWQDRSAGTRFKGERWYAWAQIGTSSPRHCLLIRLHIRTGALAFHYC
jgi:hypothetical protein